MKPRSGIVFLPDSLTGFGERCREAEANGSEDTLDHEDAVEPVRLRLDGQVHRRPHADVEAPQGESHSERAHRGGPSLRCRKSVTSGQARSA
jgi:hypothetical protein